jgi:ankyrin repeat protein
MEACIFGHREVVELLVDKGADISAKDRFGFTPLSIAKKNKHKDIVNYLKEKGATE